MADEPIRELGGKTPLQAADKPVMDLIAAKGRSGMLNSVPAGFKPGSEVANLSILGYDLNEVFEGRGSLEAASMGVPIEDGEIAMRCNLICIEDGKIKNHSAGHISDEEAAELIAFLQKELGGGDANFFAGVSYRHLLKLKGGDKRLNCTPPHDVPGQPFEPLLVKPTAEEAAKTAERINELIRASQRLLPQHLATPVAAAPRKPEKGKRRERPCKQHLAVVAGLPPENEDFLRTLRDKERCGYLGRRFD